MKNIVLLLIVILLLECGLLSCTGEQAASETPVAVNGTIVIVKPGPGSMLVNMQGTESGIILKDIKAEMGVCDQEYLPWRDPPQIYQRGDPCVILSGSISNKDREHTNFLLWAEGFNDKAQQVSWTLDAGSLISRVNVDVEKGKEVGFTIHMNPDDGLRNIELFLTEISFR